MACLRLERATRARIALEIGVILSVFPGIESASNYFIQWLYKSQFFFLCGYHLVQIYQKVFNMKKNPGERLLGSLLTDHYLIHACRHTNAFDWRGDRACLSCSPFVSPAQWFAPAVWGFSLSPGYPPALSHQVDLQADIHGLNLPLRFIGGVSAIYRLVFARQE